MNLFSTPTFLPGFFMNVNKKKPHTYVRLLLVNLLVRQPNRFLEDLRKINQLKDSPHQKDIIEEKVNRPNPKSSKSSAKVSKL